MSRIIIVEDSATYLRFIQNFLKSQKWETVSTTTLAGGKEILKKADKTDIVLCDYKFDKGNGIDLLKWMKAEGYTNPFILMTDHDHWRTATDAMKLGAVEYIPKNYLDRNIFEMLDNIKKKQEMKQAGRHVIKERKSEAFQEIYKQIRKIAKANVTVLILGENGTGKEHIAEMIHEYSRRKDNVMQSVNCSCIPEGVPESELFGHMKGSFTNATETKKGLFELADKSTLFLDEVATLTPKIQNMLLRVLETGDFRPVGATATKHTDVRLICATNENMKKAIEENRFRADLYHRIKEVVLTVPPLRECKEDIMPLAEHFLEEFNKENDMNVGGFDKEAKKRLLSYSWPGNVRELKHVVRSAALMAEGDLITMEDLDIDDDRHEVAESFEERKLQIDKERLEWALKETGGNKRKAAKLLDISPTTFYEWMDKCGMPLK